MLFVYIKNCAVVRLPLNFYHCRRPLKMNQEVMPRNVYVISRTLSNYYWIVTRQWSVTNDHLKVSCEQWRTTCHKQPVNKRWPSTSDREVTNEKCDHLLEKSVYWPVTSGLIHWSLTRGQGVKCQLINVSRDFSDRWPMTRDNFHAISDQWTVNDNQWQVAND